jgi:ABC-type transport system involved in Fe-S cluster assembly fused permease/ATPase subunit
MAVRPLEVLDFFATLTQNTSTHFRRDANKADNKAATVAVDSLINFEAVKVQLIQDILFHTRTCILNKIRSQ